MGVEVVVKKNHVVPWRAIVMSRLALTSPLRPSSMMDANSYFSQRRGLVSAIAS